MKKKSKCRDISVPIWGRKTLLIMKQLFILLLCFNLHAFSDIRAQKIIDFRVENADLKTCIKKIEELSGLGFFYNGKELEKVGGITLDVKEADVSDLLTVLLKDSGYTFELVNGIIAIIKVTENRPRPQQESLEVKGIVSDASGFPLPGVTVMIKGTGNGVVTDAQGVYKITLPDRKGTILSFSFIGMITKEITVTTQQQLDVTLEEDLKDLEEVVVTGYYNIKKSSFTGNATSISRDEMLRVNNNNIIAAIQAFDPSFRIRENNIWGSDPNALPEFNIRGESSIGMTKGLGTEQLKRTQRTGLMDNPNLPIFILDGFEVSVQKIYDMDMNRIESIYILKDAAATAMYGSRAANGVVVVTTVAPKPGELRMQYNLTANLVTPDLSDYNLCDAWEKLELERLVGIYSHEDPGVQVNRDIEYNNLLQQIYGGLNTDWMSQPLRNVLNHKHSVFVEGGVESIRYGLDFSYDSNNGVMKGSYRSRMGVGLSLDYRYKQLQIRNHLSYQSTRSCDSPYGSFSEYAAMQPYYPIHDENGKMIESYKYGKNPLYKTTLESYSGKSPASQLINNLSVNWFLIDGLQFRGQFSVSKTEKETESFIDPRDSRYYSSDAINQRGELRQSFENAYNWNLNALLQFNRGFGKHFINATAGVNLMESSTTTRSMTFKGFQLGAIHSPQSAAQQVGKTAVNKQENRLFGLLASVNYSYDNIYLADISYRLDGSSQFGSNRRFAPFWSAGVGLNVHNYSFLKENEVISLLRLRATYGSTGKVNFPSYTAVTTYKSEADTWYYTGPAAYIYYLGNPELKWETTNTFDTGVELGFLRDRIFLKFSYYIKTTEDNIDEISIQTSSGFGVYRGNFGSVENKGFEIELRSTVYRDRDWMLTLTGNIASNTNRIKELGKAAEAYNKALDDNYDSKYMTNFNELKTVPLKKYKAGASTTAIYAVRSEGIDPANGKERFITQNGESTYTWKADDQVVVGDELPEAQGSLGLNLGYKGFFLNATFLYQWGGQTYNTTLLEKVENANIATSNVDKRVLYKRWKQPGDIAPYYDINADRETKPTSRFVQDYNFLSLSGLSAGYDFDSRWISRWKLSSLGLRFNANDIVRWSSVKEERGTSYPYARTFSLTLNLGF